MKRLVEHAGCKFTGTLAGTCRTERLRQVFFAFGHLRTLNGECMIVESTSNFTTAFVYQQRHIANFTAFAALMPVWLWFLGFVYTLRGFLGRNLAVRRHRVQCKSWPEYSTAVRGDHLRCRERSFAVLFFWRILVDDDGTFVSNNRLITEVGLVASDFLNHRKMLRRMR